jgi:hypothetical protein
VHHYETGTKSVHGISSKRFTFQKRNSKHPVLGRRSNGYSFFVMQMVLSPWPSLNLGTPLSQCNILLNNTGMGQLSTSASSPSKKEIQNTQAWAGEVMATVFLVMQMVLSPWPSLNLGTPLSQSNILLNNTLKLQLRRVQKHKEHFAAT